MGIDNKDWYRRIVCLKFQLTNLESWIKKDSVHIIIVITIININPYEIIIKEARQHPGPNAHQPQKINGRYSENVTKKLIQIQRNQTYQSKLWLCYIQGTYTNPIIWE